MKKLLYTFALVACLAACKDDEKPSFSKESTFGTWVEATDTDGDGCKDAVKIDATKYFDGVSCQGGAATFDSGVVYAYSDNTFTAAIWTDNDVKFGVADANATTLKIDTYLNGVNIDQTVYTKVP